jgi:hypothetical protein
MLWETVMAEDALTALQREVLGLFFDLAESTDFVLAGGAALIASGLSNRPTNDIDLFAASPTENITSTADALEAASVTGTGRSNESATPQRSAVSSSTPDARSCSSTWPSTPRH